MPSQEASWLVWPECKLLCNKLIMFPHKNTCLHEATHVLMHCSVDVPFDYVAVYAKDLQGDFYGEVHSSTKINAPMRWITILLAGMFGEMMLPVQGQAPVNLTKLLDWDGVLLNQLGVEGDFESSLKLTGGLFLKQLRAEGRGISDSESDTHPTSRARYNRQQQQAEIIARSWLAQIARQVKVWVDADALAVEKLAEEIRVQPLRKILAANHQYKIFEGHDIHLQRLDSHKAIQVLQAAGVICGSRAADADSLALPSLSVVDQPS